MNVCIAADAAPNSLSISSCISCHLWQLPHLRQQITSNPEGPNHSIPAEHQGLRLGSADPHPDCLTTPVRTESCWLMKRRTTSSAKKQRYSSEVPKPGHSPQPGCTLRVCQWIPQQDWKPERQHPGRMYVWLIAKANSTAEHQTECTSAEILGFNLPHGTESCGFWP